MNDIIFGTETPAGRTFDMLLLWAILASVATVMIESIKSVSVSYATCFTILEWSFTILFSAEYVARIYSAPERLKYMISFWGIIDLLAVLPMYAGLFIGDAQYLLTIRALRLLRVFRILKLGKYMTASDTIISALKASSYKITVFLFGVFSVIIVMGTLMYMLEGEQNGFENIPQSIYWAIVTITTVGFGDIVPRTPLGKITASFMMIIGYAIIAVPTGIITVELSKGKNSVASRICDSCGNAPNDDDALYCKKCGKALP